MNKNLYIRPRFLTFILLFSLLAYSAEAQMPKRYTSSEIYLQLKKLEVLGNVLYVAAHPDDENTSIIATLANGKLVNAAYLSMTRGDGGQNLIGPEIREQLGIIRTQELLSARRMDGGRQFFTRANDFGYSKNPEETQRIWNREAVLGDVVWTFRKFRPDIVITRFPAEGGGGHGHHTTSAIFANEAFRLAADPDAYPEQLEYVSTWQPHRILLNTGRWWNNSITADSPGVTTIDIGEYNPLLGKSYSEISATSRSMHKSQGFGATGSRGSNEELLQHSQGSQAENDMYEGIDMTWNRVIGGKEIAEALQAIIKNFEHSDPAAIVPDLLVLREKISRLEEEFWKEIKIAEIDHVIYAATGLYLEVTTSDYSAVPGQEIPLAFEAINRSKVPMTLKSISIGNQVVSDTTFAMEFNDRARWSGPFVVSEDHPISNPYWLVKQGTLGMYNVVDPQDIGKPENDPEFEVKWTLQVQGRELEYRSAVVHKWNDRVRGEQYRPFVIQPPVMVDFGSLVEIFPSDEAKDLMVTVKAGKDDVEADVSLELPPGWEAQPKVHSVKLDIKNQDRVVSFRIKPPRDPQEDEIGIRAAVDGKVYHRGVVTIDYDHISAQVLFPVASVKLVRLDIKKAGSRIGYVEGAGDAIPESLEQIGYSVIRLTLDDISPENLKGLDAVIMGIRAVNTTPDLKFKKPILLSYVEAGGTLIHQFNTSRGINWEDFAPYELGFTGGSSDSRVSVEEAEIRMLEPNHPVLNTPNKISPKDFEGWVQERGLYFPSEWKDEYKAVLSSNDPGEDPKNGGLLIAKYGRGFYVYTGYAWFRQLPAGVPGAFRIFSNIISLGAVNGTATGNGDIKR